MMLLLCSLFCTAASAFAAARSLKAFSRHTGQWASAALAMPLGQLVFVISMLWAASSHDPAGVYFAGICAAHAFGCAGIVVLVQGMAKTQSAAVNEEHLRAAEKNERAASKYESLLAANAAQMHELCAGFAAELETLGAAIGERSASETAAGNAGANTAASFDFGPLESALGMLEEKTRSSYCANATANAIVALKARACAEAGISFSFSGNVPRELVIDGLELCSVFSNLLDNAINAARGTTEEGQPYVCLSCAARGAYLVVKVTNSCEAGSGSSVPASTSRRRKDADPVREHGWGLEIVRDICAAHDGSFSLEHTAPAEVCATAILKAVAKQN